MRRHEKRLGVIAQHLGPRRDESATELSRCDAQDMRAYDDDFPSGWLAGKVCIVTGGGRGIGAAACVLFAQAGASLVISDVDKGACQRQTQMIVETGGRAIAFPGDVLEAGFGKRVVEAAVQHFGGLHIIVNNAGFTWDGVLHKMTDAQWQAMLDVHLTAPVRICREAGKHMRAAAAEEKRATGCVQDRCILNVTSVRGLYGGAGQVNYAAAKAGVVGMTKSIAKEWGPHGIRCNAVAFGWITTRLTRPAGTERVTVNGEEVTLGLKHHDAILQSALAQTCLQRAGTPKEAASALLLLASPLASYITGQVLEVSG